MAGLVRVDGCLLVEAKTLRLRLLLQNRTLFLRMASSSSQCAGSCCVGMLHASMGGFGKLAPLLRDSALKMLQESLLPAGRLCRSLFQALPSPAIKALA